MTLGMMMALQYIMGQINAPISQFIGFAQSAQDASISLDRLGEIHEMKDEEPEDEPRIRDIPKNADIVFKDVDFQYDGPYSNKVLDGISLTIPAGKVTAIVGASGSGKTTILKMMLGFYRPVSGEICLGKTPLKNYSESCWRRECGSVMQEGYIFSDSIASNIAVSDENPDMGRVRAAADIANIAGYGIKSIFDGVGNVKLSELELTEAPGAKNPYTATAIIVVLIGLLTTTAILAKGWGVLVPVFLAVIGIIIGYIISNNKHHQRSH